MKNLKFDRDKVESEEYAKEAAERFEARCKAGDDDTSYAEAVKVGRIVEGPLDENGEVIYKR